MNSISQYLQSKPLLRWSLIGFLIATIFVLLMALYVILVIVPNSPSLDSITDYRPKIPLRIYTADGALIGEFGEEHRDFVAIKDIPPIMKDALVSIEDARFYSHGGLDFIGVLRAIVSDLTGGMRQGASTITMQVARDFFLTRDKTFDRKIREIVLAYRIENALSKDQILELYMNQIYLGQRSHGFSSAARTYFGKSLKDITIAEAAMLAGLPQNPARHNPAVNPERADKRQKLVLKSMLKQGVITEAQFDQANKEKLKIVGNRQFDAHAAYAAEMVRQSVYEQFKEETYTMGLKVYTTLLKADQEAAYEAVRRNVIAYDQRHGYRGPDAFIDLPEDSDQREEAIDAFLQKYPSNDKLLSAVVLEVSSKKVSAVLASGETVVVTGDGLKFAAAGLQANAKRDLKIRLGALIRVMQDAKERWSITQIPEVDAAYVALNAQDGAYRAMVGGFDFNRKQFNHVTSAWRQPGSAIKPFIYSAALEKGFAPSTLINDVQLSDTSLDTLQWDPRNDDGVYDGPITMQNALAKSKNVVSVRILKSIGVSAAHAHLDKFGFDLSKQPTNLTLALGTGAVTPLQMASAYAVFANGGYQIKPWLIERITDSKDVVRFQAKPPAIAQADARVLDARNAFVTDSMLREVTRSGTAASANQRLGRQDLAGKTGTTSDAVDGWFAGYAGNVVAVAWMGYDDPKSLGGREFGATLALPIWIDSMRVTLNGKPPAPLPIPENVSLVDGYWLYNEFMDGAGVKTLDLDVPAVEPPQP
jgi:penicillin-binding protein 1A